jgi:hypothetical protein
MKKLLFIGTGLVALFFASCRKPTTPIEELKIPYTSLNTTSNYLTTFKGADGNTSVDFGGQTTRISMLKEIDAYMKTGLTGSIATSKLKDMYENKNAPFANAALNSATDKTIVSKTAQSFSTADADVERQRFYGYFDAIVTANASRDQAAAEGKAGLLDGKYLVNEKGFEYGQFIQKGLIGAMMLDQISNIYLGSEKQAADNTITVSGKNYTQLEHHWDEAYGYLTSNEMYPKKDPNDATKWLESYLGSYARQVSTSVGGENPENIYLAFLTGRAAIVNMDMSTRNTQIAYIRTSLEKAIAIIAVSYLNKTKTATTDGAKFHALSEGTGFVYALRYGYNAKINKTKSDELLVILTGKTNGFWSLTNADIDNVRDQIANTFGISKEAVVNH